MPGDAGQRSGSTGEGTVAQWLVERVVSLSKILIVTLCGWISIFALFFSLYTHLYRWRRSRNGSPARLAIASVVLSVLVAFIGTFLVGHFFDIEKSVFFLILTTLLTIIDLICSKPWKELDEIDRTCR